MIFWKNDCVKKKFFNYPGKEKKNIYLFSQIKKRKKSFLGLLYQTH